MLETIYLLVVQIRFYESANVCSYKFEICYLKYSSSAEYNQSSFCVNKLSLILDIILWNFVTFWRRSHSPQVNRYLVPSKKV